MEFIWQGLLDGAAQMTWYEALAAGLGVLSVWYSKQENILVFPTGIVSVLIYVYICQQYKLYADMGINAYYFVMSVYGWIVWSSRNEDQQLTPIARATGKEWIISLAVLLGSFFLLHFILKEYTDSDVPYWDAATTSIFFIGMWLMARKKIENWIFWIVGDVITVPLYFYKGLILTSMQYIVFLFIAIGGYLAWSKTLKNID